MVAGATRSPQAHGLDLKQHDLVEGKSVMNVLQEVDHKYTGVGMCLLRTYFPGASREGEDSTGHRGRRACISENRGWVRSKCVPLLEQVI